MSCSITSTATPLLVAGCARIRSTVAAVSAAVMPAVGSSSSRSARLAARAAWRSRATASARAASAPAGRGASRSRPKRSSSACSTARRRRRRSRPSGPRRAAARADAAGSPGSRPPRARGRCPGTWNLRAMPQPADQVRRQPGDVRDRRTAPGRQSARSAPLMTLNSVVLPQPLGPMMQRSSPAASARSTPRRTCRPPKFLATARTSRSGALTALLAAQPRACRRCSAHACRLSRLTPCTGSGAFDRGRRP